MGKSSSSLKKIKHSKDSSKLRSVKKKKTKRNKSKKIRRIKDSADESELSGSDSSLYSSSEDDDYRRKKKRRSKVSKKRSWKRYSSSESESDDDDDDTRLVRKKKKSKRKDEHVKKTKKKKISSKKRRKRDSSSSYTSSESNSIRDIRSDEDSESDGKRRSRDRRRRVSKVKASPRISRDDSEGDSEPDECWQREDEVMPEENPRRLKSIVVVSNTYDNDERVDDHDDVYLTHGDNINSGNRELEFDVEFDEIDGETTIPYSRTRADDYGCETVGYDHFGENNKSETRKSCNIDNSMKEDDDLEAILKKKALENLKRFRGVTQKSGIVKTEVSSVSEGEPLQIDSEKVKESQNHGLIEQRPYDPAGSKDLEASEKLLLVGNGKDSGTVLSNFASQQDRQSDGTAKVKASSGISSCTTKRKLVRPVYGQESLNLATRKEGAGSKDAEVESVVDSAVNKKCPETENGSENIEPINLSSHADSETLDELIGDSQSEQKTNDETKDESQYEQKTMTVMRGGEMVQVSYKVYIPKKTSSLGRRKLKR